MPNSALIQFLNQIPFNANICIYGSNNIAEKLYKEIQENRKDVTVNFFIDSNKTGNLCGLPIYRITEIPSYTKEIDFAIVASYSARYYLELLLRGFGVTDILKIDKEVFYELRNKLFLNKDLSTQTSVFKTSEDKELYKMIYDARGGINKNKIYEYYISKHNEEIIGYGSNNTYSIDHYFEFINKNAIKTVIDAGGYDGLFSVMFLQRFPNCEKVFCFEPCYEKFKAPILDTIIQNDNRIEIVNKGLWNERTTLKFREELQAKTGSGVVGVKKDFGRAQQIITIDTESIDNFVNDRKTKIDFIKMDIENSEMKALEGARKTLTEHRPQLAVSIYHSDEQFLNIPVYLNEILEDYEFRLGHYSRKTLETVLYAIPKELSVR